MDYKEKYESLLCALRLAKRDEKLGNGIYSTVIEDICPEVIEDEDERTRKEIVVSTQQWKRMAEYAECEADIEKTTRMLAWLEKQKTRKWTEEDESMRKRIIASFEDELSRLNNDKYGHQEIVSDLKESCREKIDWLEKLN